MKAVHRTDYNSALQILRKGFDLSKFGSATRKTGQQYNLAARGIFVSEDWGVRVEDLPPHPWDHQDKGVYIFGTSNLQRPLKLNKEMEGSFYQNWLSDKYGGKSKSALTTAIQKEGYDGIYVQDAGEITIFDPDNFAIDHSKSDQSMTKYVEWKKLLSKGFAEWLRS